MEQLKIMFKELDEDGSGELTMDEINSAPEHLITELKEIAGTDNIHDLFDMLDYDGGGAIDTDEFCEGVIKATSSDRTSMELGRVMKQCGLILNNSRTLVAAVRGEEEQQGGATRSMDSRITDLEKDIGEIKMDISKILTLVQQQARQPAKQESSAVKSSNCNDERSAHFQLGEDVLEDC